MKYLLLFLLAALIFFSNVDTAYAQAAPAASAPVPATKPPLAKWELSPTETKLIFADGREASLIIGVRKKYQAVSKAVVKENICFPDVLPQNCSWTYEVGSYDIRFVWSKHPDVSKLKQVVIVNVYNNKTKLMMTLNDASISGLATVDAIVSKKGPILKCDSDAWLLNLPKTPSQNILVSAWGFETMRQNSISKKNENQTSFQVNDVELKSVGTNSWQVVVPEGAEDVDRLIPVTDPNTIYYENNQRQCSIQVRLEKSIIGALGIADQQPIEKTYSLPLPKSIPKNLINREVFSGVKYLTRETYTSYMVTVE
tara:strand:+ start:59030 stop:59965 length:936 start_codon:yes stop_codon:yes gene_type:complete